MLWRLLLGFIAAVAVLVIADTLTRKPKQRAFAGAEVVHDLRTGPVSAKITILRDWGTGLDARITLTNLTWTTQHRWAFLFEYPGSIQNLSGATLTARAGTKYRIDGPTSGPGSALRPGESVEFTFHAQPGGWKPGEAVAYFRAANVPSIRARFNYSEALQKSLFFYEAQRSGRLPRSNRVAWRSHSALRDGHSSGLDLTGGYYDAGDHVKFAFPLSGALTMLAWGGIEYQRGFEKAGQWKQLLATVRWGTDWLIKAHPAPNVLYGQVGEGATDHAYWGPPEQMPGERKAFKIDIRKPGSDLAGEAAAALAAASLLFQEDDAEYSALLLLHARQLFAFAERHRGLYSKSIPDAENFYPSSGYEDELVWAAAWIYRATHEPGYLAWAEAAYESWLKNTLGARTHTWDDKRYGTAVLLAQITKKPVYKADVEKFLDAWVSGDAHSPIIHTPGGLAWLEPWGSLRYAANTAFLAFVYCDTVADFGNVYHRFACRQINYMLGDNPHRRSYVVGFGRNPPMNPHHRAAHGSETRNIDEPILNRNVLYGALVGGPYEGSDTSFHDERRDEASNEVALDYNAAFTGALARMVMLYGGRPLADFPPAAENQKGEHP